MIPRRVWLVRAVALVLAVACAVVAIVHEIGSRANAEEVLVPTKEKIAGVWIGREELARLPAAGPAWESLLAEANRPAGTPDLSDQESRTNLRVLAKALVHAKTGEARYRDDVVRACLAAVGTEKGGRTLSLGWQLAAYVVAADLVGLPPETDLRFRDWLREVLALPLDGQTLRSTHEERPNNWGTAAGASRAAVAAYLGDERELGRTALVFKGWLGDREAYASFRFGDLSWQADPEAPVGVNPAGASRDGLSIDGVLPDDQRRAGPFASPPPKENYVYTALQGALVQAVILSRAGFDVWEWEDRALYRAFRWLHEEARFPAEGDDTWLPHLVNHYYESDFPAPVPASPGKVMGFTDWTHSGRAGGG
ncbi:MAG: alginate lyase family protein [Planctomycetes bacterium]|nr:alginate lyase family protein [Planctomycetota bacterium]